MALSLSTNIARLNIALVAAMLIVGSGHALANDTPEPGPERGGLRLRLIAGPSERNDGGYEMRIDILNTSASDVTLRTAWERDNTGTLAEYLEAATSIESYPAFEPWKGGLQAFPLGNEPKQFEQVLKGRETLTVRWHAKGPTLKNKVSDPFRAQNPSFDMPGMYAIHAKLAVETDRGTIWLRSNEQLLSFGGSSEMPKHTYGPVSYANADKMTAILGLGAEHKVQVGDKFDITSKQAHWRLTVTEVEPRYSETKLELLSSLDRGESGKPPEGSSAVLVRE